MIKQKHIDLLDKYIEEYIGWASSDSEDDMIFTSFYIPNMFPLDYIIDRCHYFLKQLYFDIDNFVIDILDRTDALILNEGAILRIYDLESIKVATKEIREKLKWMKKNKIYKYEYLIEHHIWMNIPFYQELYYLYGTDIDVKFEHYLDYPKNGGNQKVIWERMILE